MSLITIYITNYNYEAYLERAIESVLNQEKVDFELIIIDDGSTDNSKTIIEKYRKLNNVRIVYQQNKGLNITNNIALSLSDGAYIMRLDADDYLADDALFKLSKKLDEDPSLGLVFPDYYLVDQDENILEHHKRHDFQKEVSLYDQAAHGACTMIRTRFLKELGGYNENYKCQDGYELWIKFVNKYKVTNINEPLFYYRQHGSNLTGNEDKILNTRAAINADYVESLNLESTSIAVIPIRSAKDKIANLPFRDSTVLKEKIKEALHSKLIKQVIVSSPDENTKDQIGETLLKNEKVVFHLRSQSSASFSVSLDQTIKEVLTATQDNNEVSSILILDINFPLINHVKMDDAINTMLLFKADSIISVRSDNSSFFKHDGTGMKSIFGNSKLSRLERDVIYKHVGGLTAVRKSHFLDSDKIISGKVGHIVMDKNSSFKLENKRDIEISEFINDMYKILC